MLICYVLWKFSLKNRKQHKISPGFVFVQGLFLGLYSGLCFRGNLTNVQSIPYDSKTTSLG